MFRVLEFRQDSALAISVSRSSRARGARLPYAPGSRHPIRYNPADPSDMRFDVGYNFGFFFLPVLFGGMGIVFSALGVGLLFASRSVRELQCPVCGRPVEKGQNFCPNCAAPLPAN